MKTWIVVVLSALLLPYAIATEAGIQPEVPSAPSGGDMDVHAILIEELGNLAIESYEFAKRFGLVKSGPIPLKPSTAGIELVGKILKEETSEVVLEPGGTWEAVAGKLRAAILGSPRSRIVKDAALEHGYVVSGVIGSGAMNMNPAVIIGVIYTVEGRTTVLVKAVAKEGLIKQKTAEKAVKRIVQSF